MKRLLELSLKALDGFVDSEGVSYGYYLSKEDDKELELLIEKYKNDPRNNC
jgi:hypothetical protein